MSHVSDIDVYSPDYLEVEKFFFEAMLNGYASSNHPERNTPFPGWETFKCLKEKFRLIDMWHTTSNSNHSGGVTMVYYGDTPLWVMHYGGWYSPEAIPILKNALRWNYERKLFVGGRGPLEFVQGEFFYSNEPVRGYNNFLNGEGDEFIRHLPTKRNIGGHWYKYEWLL